MEHFNYVGIKKNKNYFEGWYFRVVDNNNCLSFIFGITYNEENPHSFIQVLDQINDQAYYFKFKISDFAYQNNMIKIKANLFSPTKLKLLVGPFDVDLNIKPVLNLNKHLGFTSIMSYFKYLPIPLCHEIIFMKAEVTGHIKINNDIIKVSGLGYMEKDLGTKFPQRWLWLQTNSFANNDVSLVISKADLFAKLTGFFCVLNVNNREYRFATYNNAKIKHRIVNQKLNIEIKKGSYVLKIIVDLKPGHLIIAPIKKAKMEKKIEESLISTLALKLYQNKQLIIKDEAVNVASEYLF